MGLEVLGVVAGWDGLPGCGVVGERGCPGGGGERFRPEPRSAPSPLTAHSWQVTRPRRSRPRPCPRGHCLVQAAGPPAVTTAEPAPTPLDPLFMPWPQPSFHSRESRPCCRSHGGLSQLSGRPCRRPCCCSWAAGPPWHRAPLPSGPAWPVTLAPPHHHEGGLYVPTWPDTDVDGQRARVTCATSEQRSWDVCSRLSLPSRERRALAGRRLTRQAGGSVETSSRGTGDVGGRRAAAMHPQPHHHGKSDVVCEALASW